MQTHILLEGISVIRSANATAAGTTPINGSSIDMQTLGARALLCIACLGALTSTQVTKLKLQGSDDNSTWADLTHTDYSVTSQAVATAAAADADGNKMLVLDCKRISHRYVRPVLVRGTANAVLDSLVSIPYEFSVMPAPAADATVSQQAKFTDAA